MKMIKRTGAVLIALLLCLYTVNTFALPPQKKKNVSR